MIRDSSTHCLQTQSLEPTDPPSTAWTRLCTLVRELGSLRILDVTQMKKTLEFNLLVDSGLWSDKPGLEKRLVKINTSLVYRQQKYNLLREESEGYSKLLTVLAALPSPPNDPASHIANVFALIGYFDLDPNRVLDMVLEVMENQLWNSSFLLLLKKFRKSSIAHVMGFKFAQYHEDSDSGESGSSTSDTPSSPRGDSTKPTKGLGSPEDVSSPPQLPVGTPTPRSLCLLAATLLTTGLLDLDTILPYLAPNLDETGKLMIKERNRLKAAIKSYGVVNLSGKASTDADKEKEKSANKTITASTKDFAGGNQIIGVVCALILVKNWNLASEMFHLLQTVASVNAVDFPDVTAALIALVSWAMDDVYRPIGYFSLKLAAPAVTEESNGILPLVPCFSGSEGGEESGAAMDVGHNEDDDEAGAVPMKSFHNKQFEVIEFRDQVVVQLKPLLIALGHHLSGSADLFSRVCRVLKVRMETLVRQCTPPSTTVTDEAKLLAEPELKDILLIISETLLPALTKFECNPALAALLWGLLSQLPFQVRFDMYGVWKGDGFGKEVISEELRGVAFMYRPQLGAG